MRNRQRLRTTGWGVVLGVALAGTALAPAASAATVVPTTPGQQVLQWEDCKAEGKEDPAVVKGSQCATLQVPVDWNRPDGPTFGLAVARRTAKTSDARVGSLVFGPGGPGDSGVSRVKTGMQRFSANLQNRFDVVSFDPRGIGKSNPVRCSAALLARQPSPIITNRAEYDKTLRYNRELAKDCRTNTGPVFDHIDTLQTVHDLDALRAALGEEKLTFHGSSYGTLLGAQYAEVFPQRVRAAVLESVIDHSLGTRGFMDIQAAAAQDSFDQFVKWCDSSTECALHDRDVRALWADLLARAARKELPDPNTPGGALSPFTLGFGVFKQFYDPSWRKLAGMLKTLDESKPPVVVDPEPPTGLKANTFAVFCQDWSLPVGSYSGYTAHVRRITRANPDFTIPALLPIATCLGAPTSVDNPQHRLKVRGLETPLLLTNAVYDPASSYAWASNVARQVGREGVLLTYQGWGHGTYSTSPCAKATIDAYLIVRRVPARGTSCPAVPPTG